MDQVISLSQNVHSDGGCLLLFTGPANRVVSWSIISGSGLINVIDGITDVNGQAQAIYSPNGYTGLVTIGVSYGV